MYIAVLSISSNTPSAVSVCVCVCFCLSYVYRPCSRVWNRHWCTDCETFLTLCKGESKAESRFCSGGPGCTADSAAAGVRSVTPAAGAAAGGTAQQQWCRCCSSQGWHLPVCLHVTTWFSFTSLQNIMLCRINFCKTRRPCIG